MMSDNTLHHQQLLLLSRSPTPTTTRGLRGDIEDQRGARNSRHPNTAQMTHSADTRTTMEKRGCPIGLKHKLHGPKTHHSTEHRAAHDSCHHSTDRAATNSCHRATASSTQQLPAIDPWQSVSFLLQDSSNSCQPWIAATSCHLRHRRHRSHLTRRQDTRGLTRSEETNSEEEVLSIRAVIPPEELEERGTRGRRLPATNSSLRAETPPLEERGTRGRRIPGKKSSHTRHTREDLRSSRISRRRRQRR